jgi:uncharacterized membrane protein YdjX (TVP38/TMEM64 family)
VAALGSRRASARLAALGVLLCVVFVAGLLVAPHSAQHLRHQFGNLDIWGPVAVLAVYALPTCAFVPGPVLAGASGLLFGTAAGTGLAIVSATLCACVAFLVARAGMTRIRLREFAGATAIGASPRAFAYAALGGSIGDYSSPQALAAIAVLVAMALVGAGLVWRARASG